MSKKRYLRPELDDLQMRVANAAGWDAVQGSCKVGPNVSSLCHTGSYAVDPPGCKSGIYPGSTGPNLGTDPLQGP